MTTEQRIAPMLLLLRLGVFIVMFASTLDKFINPEPVWRFMHCASWTRCSPWIIG